MTDKITLKALLGHFHPDDVADVAKVLKRTDVDGGVLASTPTGYTCLAFGPGSTYKTLKDAWYATSEPVAHYIKRSVTRNLEASLAWLKDNPQASMRDAAKKFGIDVSAISRAIKRERCPCCGQPMPRTSRP